MIKRNFKLYLLSTIISISALSFVSADIAVASSNVNDTSQSDCQPDNQSIGSNSDGSDSQAEKLALGPCGGTGVPVGTGTNAGVGGAGQGQNTNQGGMGSGAGSGQGTGPIRSQDRIHQ